MPKNKVIALVVGAVVIIGVLVIAFSQGGSSSSGTPVVSGEPTSTPITTGQNQYTLTEVAAHPNAASCWSAINGGVYDLTAWISQHPGGEQAILSICGKDGSAAFNNQHGGAQRQADILATFKIGTLAQ